MNFNDHYLKMLVTLAGEIMECLLGEKPITRPKFELLFKQFLIELGKWNFGQPPQQKEVYLPGILKLVKLVRSLQREAERGDMEVVRRMREGEAELDECLKAYPI